MISIYNQQGFADTLLCLFHQETPDITPEISTHGDYTIIKENARVIGVNIKLASKKFEHLVAGVNLGHEQDEVVSTAILKATGLKAEELTSSLNQNFVIGTIETCASHPDSDKLSVCQVNIGTDDLQIVCGAANVAAGQKVVVAQIGSMMPNGLIIAPSVLRKVASQGMICSAKELRLPEAWQAPGILVLDDDAPVGADFMSYFAQEKMGQ